MGLPWIRLDTSMFSNPKLLRLIGNGKHRAVVVHLSGMCWVGQQGMDGHIPTYVLPLIHGRMTDVKDLLAEGLWQPDVGGWSINGWDEYQVSDDAAKARSDKARKAALKRWHGSEGGRAHG